MATLSDVWSRLIERGMDRSAGAARGVDISTRIRTFPNESILFYMKRIDNSGVIRQPEAGASRKCWRLIGSTVGGAVLVIGALLPSSYGLLYGYQIESLRAETQRLMTEQASLDLREARLLSPARMEELAREQQFVDPPPDKVIYLDNGPLAMNRR